MWNRIASFRACTSHFSWFVCTSFLTTFCNKSLLKQVLRPRIAPSPPRRFAACVSSFFFFCGSLILWPLQVAIHFCIPQIPKAHVPHKREINQIQCKRPYDTATYYLHTAIWLGRGQSILTQVEPTSEPDAVCNRFSPLILTTFCPSEPEFFGWPLTQTGGQM